MNKAKKLTIFHFILKFKYIRFIKSPYTHFLKKTKPKKITDAAINPNRRKKGTMWSIL